MQTLALNFCHSNRSAPVRCPLEYTYYIHDRQKLRLREHENFRIGTSSTRVSNTTELGSALGEKSFQQLRKPRRGRQPDAHIAVCNCEKDPFCTGCIYLGLSNSVRRIYLGLISTLVRRLTVAQKSTGVIGVA